jgi:hypothetical protein
MRAARRTRALAAVLIAAAVVAASTSAAAQPSTDRTVKLDLIAKLRRGPAILILGDSRGRQAEPSLLQKLTGHTAFNAAVTGGATPDAWVFTRYTADLFPQQKRRYIWFVSWGLATNIVTPWLTEDPRGRHYLQEVAAYLSTQSVTPPPQRDTPTHYRTDGSLRIPQPPPTPTQVAEVKAEAAQKVAAIQRHPPVTPAFDPSNFQLFEHLLAYVNGRGERPVIVINPIYPTILAELRQYGDPLTTSSLAYLRSLRQRYDFVLVDCENSHAWGGSDSDWNNPTHIDRANMRRMLRYIVAHSDGALS